LGLVAHAAESGKQAIEAIERDKYDLLLLDCQMPDMDGYEVARTIRQGPTERAYHLPIIALTASAMPEDRERCYAAGLDDFLAKPLHKNDLAVALQRWLP